MCQAHDQHIGNDRQNHEGVKGIGHDNVKGPSLDTQRWSDVFLLGLCRCHYSLNGDPLLLRLCHQCALASLPFETIELVDGHNNNHVKDEEYANDDKDDKVERHEDVIVEQRLLVERRTPHRLEQDGGPVLEGSNLKGAEYP